MTTVISDTNFHMHMLIQQFPEQDTMLDMGKDNKKLVSSILRIHQIWLRARKKKRVSALITDSSMGVGQTFGTDSESPVRRQCWVSETLQQTVGGSPGK